MKKIDDKMIDDVAILAKLELSQEERGKVLEDLVQMVEYIDKLKEIDTEGIEAMTHIFSQQNVFRDDIVVNGDNHKAILMNAPKQIKDQYHVPKTVE